MSPVSDCDGAIRHVLFSVTRREGAYTGAIYTSLMASLPPGTGFTLMCEAGTEALANDWLEASGAAGRARIVTTGKTTRLTMWARDPVLGFGHDSSPFLSRSPSLKRAHDRRTGGILQRHLGWAARPTPCAFEGGNLLIGDDFALVGADTLVANGWPDDPRAIPRMGQWLSRADGSPRRIIPVASRLAVPQACDRIIRVRGEDRIERLYSRNRRGTRQPLFHIDLFLTLGGRDASNRAIIFVGDPRLAARLLEWPLHDAALAEHFDDIAVQLEEAGFRVVRLALPLLYMDFLGNRRKRRETFFASSNNALVEIDGKGNRSVWLSTFAHDHWPELDVTDQHNRQIWEQHGFRVVPVAQGQWLAENLGGLHCMANIVSRGA